MRNPRSSIAERLVAILLISLLASTSLASTVGAADPASEQQNSPHATHDKPSGWIGPILFFQKTISKADGDRCPMYPSCSQYAINAIKSHGFLKGWVLTSDRLLRCGRDETRLAPKVKMNGKAYAYDPLKANTFWWDER